MFHYFIGRWDYLTSIFHKREKETTMNVSLVGEKNPFSFWGLFLWDIYAEHNLKSQINDSDISWRSTVCQVLYQDASNTYYLI